VPLLLFGASQVASALAREERTEVSEVDAAGLRRVEIHSVGSVRVVGVEGAGAVTVTARIRDGFQATRHDVRREGDRLVVDSSCPILTSWCDVNYTVELPSHLAVAARSGDGSVTITDVAADVEASSGNGSVELARIEGDVVLESGNGSVTAGDLRAARAEAHSGNGSVSLTFVDPPGDVVATSGNGSIDVVLPRGDELYRLDPHSGNGTVSTPVRADPASERSITARSGNGDVTITYALD
jgi:hypothetical protein